jgi:hypothetical protein
VLTVDKGNYVHPDTPEEIFYHDVEPDLQTKAIAAIKHQSAPVFTDEVVYEPWHDVQCMFFYCDADKALPLVVQEQMASLLGPKALTYHSKGSHSPFLSEVQEVGVGTRCGTGSGHGQGLGRGRYHEDWVAKMLCLESTPTTFSLAPILDTAVIHNILHPCCRSRPSSPLSH